MNRDLEISYIKIFKVTSNEFDINFLNVIHLMQVQYMPFEMTVH